jgi:hypothetical protein
MRALPKRIKPAVEDTAFETDRTAQPNDGDQKMAKGQRHVRI